MNSLIDILTEEKKLVRELDSILKLIIKYDSDDELKLLYAAKEETEKKLANIREAMRDYLIETLKI